MRPAEIVAPHSRLLKVAIEVEHSRAFWEHHRPERDLKEEVESGFSEFWFGTRSYAAVRNLISNFHHRFTRIPAAMRALSEWRDLSPEEARLICHWHLQLADPIYRAFSGEFLVERRSSLRGTVTRDAVIAWVDRIDTEQRWTKTTHIQFASKLLSSAHGAGLVASTRDPRPVVLPKVPDAALAYLLHLLREVQFTGKLHDNLYLRSVGLHSSALEDRLRTLAGVTFRRIGDVTEFDWEFGDLRAWSKRQSS